jgi:hypothetical protein
MTWVDPYQAGSFENYCGICGERTPQMIETGCLVCCGYRATIPRQRVVYTLHVKDRPERRYCVGSGDGMRPSMPCGPAG